MKMTLIAALTLTASVEAAFSADTPPPAKTIGINPAFRNLSVKPGDDFEEYANGGWRKCRDSRRPRQHRRGLRSFRARGKTQRRSGPRSRCGQSAAGYAAENHRRVLRRLHGHGQHREARARSAQRKAARNRCDKNENGPGSVLGERLRADVDPLMPPCVMWTENLFGVWVTQALSEPNRTVPYFFRAGWGCLIASITCRTSRKWPSNVPPTKPTSVT